ncbi:MAG: PA2169 family four-helix-bundle protein [Chitinophagaceae bacterium]
MEINENLTDVLNDLIRINNDRIAGYKRAADEADNNDVDLKAIFHRMAEESRQYISELTREVVKLGGEPATGTTASGKIYRAWMDVKATFTGNDREAVLTSCEYGEDAAQKSYQEALTSDETLSIDIRQLIANQKASLQISHDTIKKYRDMYRNTNSDNLKDADNLTSSTGLTGTTSSNYGSSSRSGNLSDRDRLTDSDNSGGSGDSGNSGNLRGNL